MPDREYARRIKKLRQALGLTQYALAARLRVQPQVVASWEQGRREPSAASYRRLADLAPPKDAWFFLEQIGVTKRLVRSKWPGGVPRRPGNTAGPPPLTTRVRLAGGGEHLFVQFPLLREAAPASPHEITAADIESVIALPADLLPARSAALAGIRVGDEAMAPVLRKGFIVVVDGTQRDAALLSGYMVALWSEGGPLLRWLTLDRAAGELVLRPHDAAAAALRLPVAQSGRILGKIVYWWGSQG